MKGGKKIHFESKNKIIKRKSLKVKLPFNLCTTLKDMLGHFYDLSPTTIKYTSFGFFKTTCDCVRYTLLKLDKSSSCKIKN
jgi:hypothetical protein